ncbi:MAG: hypothetical protein OEW75_09455 [Cyclobacteriaceae bacterium]|nr:hypothetical protein [Cyclobacteriaceae bacterium]
MMENFNNPSALILEERHEIMKNYVLLVSSALGSKEFRKLLKEEALKKFDGDFDVLSANFHNRILNTQISVNEILELMGKKSEVLKSKNIDPTKLTQFITELYPNVQISVPVNCETWNTDNFIPPVVFLNEVFDDTKVDFVEAFDENGKTIKLGLDQEPDFPVVVVGISERVDINGNFYADEEPYYLIQRDAQTSGRIEAVPAAPNELGMLHGSAGSFILNWQDVSLEDSYEVWRMEEPTTAFYKVAETTANDNGYVDAGLKIPLIRPSTVWYKIRAKNIDGVSSWSPIMASKVSGRNDGEPLTVKRMKFTQSALQNVESWVAGAPELRLRVIMGSPPGENQQALMIYESSILEPNKRGDIMDTWWNKSVSVMPFWYTGTHQTVLTFDWKEEDPLSISGTEFTLNAGYEDKGDNGNIKFGGNVKVTVSGRSSSNVGMTFVHWWDPKSVIYSTGGFSWEFVY